MSEQIKIEDSQYNFITDGFLRPVAPIRRFSQGKNRFYYRVEETGDITLFSSGTTLIKDGFAESEAALEEWRNKLKSEGKNPVYELNYAACRGTIMHVLAGDLIQQIEVNLEDLNAHITTLHPEVTTEPLYYDVINNETLWLQKAVLSFAQFINDYNIKPLAIELILTSSKYQVASPIDLICTMDVSVKGFWGEIYKTGPNKGEPKETKKVVTQTAIIDMKSSQKGFYDKQALQLKLYKHMVGENYPEIVVDALYNWSPKDWTGETPTYNLKEQSSGRLNDLAECVFEQGRIKHKWKTPMVNIPPKSIRYGDSVTFRQVPLVEYLKELHNKKDGKGGTEEESK